MKWQKSKNINRGAAIISIFFAMLFFLLIGRFTHIQTTGVVDGQVLAALAEKKYTKQRTIEAQRGTIYDRTGQAIAQDTPAYTVVAILDETLPSHVLDPFDTARKLAPLLNMSEEEVIKILTKDKKQVEFGSKGRDISHSLKLEIEALEIPGIAFIRDSKRYYPNGTFASHTIGYAQKVEDEDKSESVTVGMLGLEKSLNDYLVETDGYLKFQSDNRGFRLPETEEQIVPPQNGNDIYLTIDQKIQTFLEDSMNKVVQQYEPKKIIGIVAHAKTGEILAMSTRPSFDPNVRNISNYLNDAISYRFEPGSTMKIFTLAAAVEEGVYNGEEAFQSGEYHVGRFRIRDHNKRGWGKISYDEGVQRSSNVAFAKLAAEKLGTDTLLQYLNRFGFHQPTGINIDGEVNSIINFTYELEKITTAFGQGSAITPIQQVQAATAITNNGVMMKPYVVDRIVDSSTNKVINDYKPVEVGKPISEGTSKKVLDILETVVTSENGTGQVYAVDGYNVAGKTGTAQIPNPTGETPYLSGHGNNIFSFIGMAPKEDPKLIVYIAVEQPKLKEYEKGSEPVSMIFNPVMKNSLQYLNIEPVKKKESPGPTRGKLGIEIESYVGTEVEQVMTDLTAKGLNVISLGSGKVVKAQIPTNGENVILGERVVLLTEGNVVMPDVTGWSLRDVMKVANLVKLKPNVVGKGYVFQQNLAPGTKLKEDDYLIVHLKPPYSPEESSELEDGEEGLEESPPID
ncbi:penicillin-binding protein [Bacillus luteolus]|uniref:serine-type D-Ala-D-Ala carboxypeptidase n=1 Tax=Litchfieldia luteola TaxID=682179 RepID=A0ABR9QJZ6_9BACI|nr:penicillin-binding protein [Cytobacillus luteolus]MBE4908826.1 penicillin-binding protein [Cytobacillus luteolus]MBP1941684.1 penicillin-binding protein 2B [Cytobacillus luteolus]